MQILILRDHSSPTSLLQILEIFSGNRQSSLRGPTPLCQLRSDKLVTCFTRKTRSYFRFAPAPYPRVKTVSNNSPPPGPKSWTCPGVARGGGMVTGKIEPCINLHKYLICQQLCRSDIVANHQIRCRHRLHKKFQFRFQKLTEEAVLGPSLYNCIVTNSLCSL